MTTTKTIIMNVAFTFDVDVEGEVTPETIRQSILSEREEFEWTEGIKDQIDFSVDVNMDMGVGGAVGVSAGVSKADAVAGALLALYELV